MNCFDIRAAYNGRTLIMPSDTDRIVFVNNRDIKWDDGSAVTTDEMVSFLKIYGQDQLKPRKERQFRYKIWFVDGQGSSYGDSILFHENGEPVLKIENGIIRSSSIKCGCETRFPAAANLGMRTAGDYEWFREQVEDSGQFDKCRKNIYAPNERYICRACRTVWILGKPDSHGCYLWCREETLNNI